MVRFERSHIFKIVIKRTVLQVCYIACKCSNAAYKLHYGLIIMNPVILIVA